jgi:hypothetical protein
VSSIRERKSPDLGLVRTGPCSNFNVGQNTSSRVTIQAVFLFFFNLGSARRHGDVCRSIRTRLPDSKSECDDLSSTKLIAEVSARGSVQGHRAGILFNPVFPPKHRVCESPWGSRFYGNPSRHRGGKPLRIKTLEAAMQKTEPPQSARVDPKERVGQSEDTLLSDSFRGQSKQHRCPTPPRGSSV